MRGEKGFDLLAERLVTGAGPADKRLTFVRGEF